MKGYPGLERISDIAEYLQPKEFRSRFSVLICTCGEIRLKAAYREFDFGKRADGDILLHFKKEIVSPVDKRLPRRTIEYWDSNANLTSVSIRLNVIS